MGRMASATRARRGGRGLLQRGMSSVMALYSRAMLTAPLSARYP